MNMTVNKTTFNGKAEILYGLKKASDVARLTEKARSLACGPRPTNTSLEVSKYRGELSAYLDMVVSDKNFVETISEISKSKSHKIYEELHKKLTPIKTFGVEFSPFTTFQDAFMKTCNAKLPIASNQEKNMFAKFFNNITLGIK